MRLSLRVWAPPPAKQQRRAAQCSALQLAAGSNSREGAPRLPLRRPAPGPPTCADGGVAEAKGDDGKGDGGDEVGGAVALEQLLGLLAAALARRRRLLVRRGQRFEQPRLQAVFLGRGLRVALRGATIWGQFGCRWGECVGGPAAAGGGRAEPQRPTAACSSTCPARLRCARLALRSAWEERRRGRPRHQRACARRRPRPICRHSPWAPPPQLLVQAGGGAPAAQHAWVPACSILSARLA